MIVLSKEQIEEMVDPDQMMDQIEEAYRIYGSGEFYMPPRPTVEHENKQPFIVFAPACDGYWHRHEHSNCP